MENTELSRCSCPSIGLRAAVLGSASQTHFSRSSAQMALLLVYIYAWMNVCHSRGKLMMFFITFLYSLLGWTLLAVFVVII